MSKVSEGSIGATHDKGRNVLAVIAHPDDESFGLGAIIDALVRHGMTVPVLCFTAGESSTLGCEAVDLASVRRAELTRAAKALRLHRTVLLDYPDGGLAGEPLATLVRHVVAAGTDADALLVFDQSGVTGHPDHIRATEAALAAADTLDLPVHAWAIDQTVADQLNAEFGTTFAAVERDRAALVLTVDRTVQYRAFECHRSQSNDNAVLHRRLALQRDEELLLQLREGGSWRLSV